MKPGKERPFFFLFLHGGAISRRPTAVKGAPFFRRGVSEPLTAVGCGECIVWGGKGRPLHGVEFLSLRRKP